MNGLILIGVLGAANGYWPTYVREWTFWNHVRTVAALASAACGVFALIVW